MTGTKVRGIPAVITALASKAKLVRQAAADLGLTYEESAVAGRDDLVRFRFGEIDEATTRKLVTAIPRHAYAHRAILSGEPPPGSERWND